MTVKMVIKGESIPSECGMLLSWEQRGGGHYRSAVDTQGVYHEDMGEIRGRSESVRQAATPARASLPWPPQPCLLSSRRSQATSSELSMRQCGLIDTSGGHNTHWTLTNRRRDGREAHVRTEGLQDA